MRRLFLLMIFVDSGFELMKDISFVLLADIGLWFLF